MCHMENLEGIHSLPQFRSESKGDFWLDVIGDRFEEVLEKWVPDYGGDWRILEGVRILDLGCGLLYLILVMSTSLTFVV